MADPLAVVRNILETLWENDPHKTGTIEGCLDDLANGSTINVYGQRNQLHLAITLIWRGSQ